MGLTRQMAGWSQDKDYLTATHRCSAGHPFSPEKAAEAGDAGTQAASLARLCATARGQVGGSSFQQAVMFRSAFTVSLCS